MKLLLLPNAEVDLFQAALWYETRREGLGHAFDEDFNQLAYRMKNSPFQFPEFENSVRRALFKRFPYGCFFIVQDNTVVVFAILHLHRAPDTWKLRRPR